MTLKEAEIIIEALIFAAERPIRCEDISSLLELKQSTVEALIENIRGRHGDGALMIRNVAGGYQFVTRPDVAPWIEKMGRPVVNTPLSLASTETLAIIAYEQPVTKAEIEQIRGVRSDSALNNLLERELICEMGRKEGPVDPFYME